MHRLLPFLRWLPEVRQPGVWRRDLIAGVTVATVLVPQAMAYARLAGLPPVYGLYAAFLPPVIAAFWGSSRHLATGPVAMASLISAAAIAPLAQQGSELFISYAILLAVMVGVLRLLLGLLRLGVLVNLLSGPVVAGFTNAAAIIIATSQLHHVLGVTAEPGTFHFETVANVVLAAAQQARAAPLLMAMLAGLILVGLRRRNERILVAVVVTTIVAWVTGYAGETVGEIPRGLPAFSLPAVDLSVAAQLVPGAITLTLIGLMEAMSIAKTIATRSKQHIDVNQELVGQGLSNLVGGLFGSYAVSGSFSRSAINFASGGATGLSSAVTSVVVMLTLLLLTPLFFHLPQATLAMIIILAVLGLIRIEPIREAWRVSRRDGVFSVVTFAITLALAPQLHWGIVIGVGLSLAGYLQRTMRPHFAYLARHADGALVDADAHNLALDPHIAILRFDGRLYFGAAGFFEDKVLEALGRLPDLRFLVLDAGGINQIDATGVQALRRVVQDLRGIGIEVYFTRVKHSVYELLVATDLAFEIGEDHFLDWNQHALEHLWGQMEPSYKARSPLNVATPDAAANVWSI
ncbi:MAG TPA: sulfate permease [Candidatus Latescibacteria bacterium]|jgi:SulP family sulfate permease|nr:sodium-independent anion transporter [Gemmatimonadaceae bacterium]MDP6016792.1 sulfate permease [Candidatus Latescibacterota bacterium]HJP31368.1 sulfate permease [Candidatus Latescibacterota bacterium]